MINKYRGKVFIIHGAYGHPKENWFPWLKNELEKKGFKVYVPKFPTPEGQSLGNWFKVFQKFMNILDEETIMIGHSLGSAFILNVLERSTKKIKAAFFVAPFAGLLGNSTFDAINRTFVDKQFDWKNIKSKCKKFYVYSSDNDPYVPLEKSKGVADKLGAELKIVNNAGHFNKASGYTKFELLLKDIESVMP